MVAYVLIKLHCIVSRSRQWTSQENWSITSSNPPKMYIRAPTMQAECPSRAPGKLPLTFGVSHSKVLVSKQNKISHTCENIMIGSDFSVELHNANLPSRHSVHQIGKLCFHMQQPCGLQWFYTFSENRNRCHKIKQKVFRPSWLRKNIFMRDRVGFVQVLSRCNVFFLPYLWKGTLGYFLSLVVCSSDQRRFKTFRTWTSIGLSDL